jgi:hypothetical protein
MQMVRSSLLRASLVFLVSWLALAPSTRGQEGQDLAKVAALACQANLDAFPYFTCRYTMTLANVDSPAAAVRGEFRNAKRFDHILVVDEHREKLQYLGPPIVPNRKELRPIKGTNLSSVAVDWIPWAYLNKDEHTFHYLAPMATAGVSPPEFGPRVINWLPPSMGIMGDIRCDGSPWKLMQKCDGEKQTVKAAAEEIEGRPMVKLTFAKNKRTIYEYWLDVQQGYLPQRGVFYTLPEVKGSTEEAHLLEAQQPDGKHWFPMHMVFIQHPPGMMRAVDIHVTDLEVKKRPAASDFTLKVPAGTVIQSRAPGEGRRPSFRLKQDEKISADDIPRLEQMLEKKAEQPRMDTAVHPPRPPYWRYALIAACLVVPAVGFVLWRRHRSSST